MFFCPILSLTIQKKAAGEGIEPEMVYLCSSDCSTHEQDLYLAAHVDSLSQSEKHGADDSDSVPGRGRDEALYLPHHRRFPLKLQFHTSRIALLARHNLVRLLCNSHYVIILCNYDATRELGLMVQ